MTILLALTLALSAASAKDMPAYGEWHSSRIGGGGYALDVVPCPSDPNRFYSFIDVGGIYRSDDGGMTWRMLHGALPASRGSYGCRGGLVDPRNADKLVAAVGDHYAPAMDGLFLSNDGGTTWKPAGPRLDFDGNGTHRFLGKVLARDPKNPDVILAASMGTGVWRSADNGATWKNTGLDKINCTDVRFDQKNPSTAWLCALPLEQRMHGVEQKLEGGFFKSADAGLTWTKISAESPGEILQDPVQPGTLYGIFGTWKVKKSEDGGVTWADYAQGLPVEPDQRGKGNVSPGNFRALTAGPDFVLLGASDGSIFKLNRENNLWERIERESMDVQQTELAALDPARIKAAVRRAGWAMSSITVDPHNPQHWFFSSFFGVCQSFDAGKNWKVTVDGMELTCIHKLLQNPADPQVVHLGMMDNCYLRSDDGGNSFLGHSLPGVPISCKQIDLSAKNPSRVYNVTSIGPSQHIAQVNISDDGGTTWKKSSMSGLPDLSKFACNSLAVDPRDPQIVYLGVAGTIAPNGGGPYKSSDGGQTWTWIGEGLPEGQQFFFNSPYTQANEIAVGPDGNVLILSRLARAIFRRDSDGKTWTRCEFPGRGDYRGIEADLLKAGQYYVPVFSEGLFRTRDSGSTWQKVYKESVAYVILDKAVQGRVAVSTDDGVVFSPDEGATWEPLDKSLPDRVRMNMGCFAGDRLLVGSSGSGVFWTRLPEAKKPGR